MSFQSLAFYVFLFLLIVMLAIIKKEVSRQYLLIAASVIFYGLWDVRFLTIVAICIATIFIGSRAIGRSEEATQKRILTVCLVILLGTLGVFKYMNFFIEGFCNLLGITQTFSLNLILPVGISFYVFSAIGYIVDVYRGEISASTPLYQTALFVLFFPKLLQGPFHPATDFIEQLKRDHPVSWSNLSAGGQIFLCGLIKKVVIADRLGVYVDAVYSTPAAYSGLTLLLVSFTYPIQMLCDFSGYTDMAIGTAKMIGYDLCPNFNLPFLAKNVAEFWRRWHMSLNAWFREYLFYPVIRCSWVNTLRKNAKKKSKKFSRILPSMIGMIIVWPLIGLWHGATWNYVLFDSFYGLLMIASLFINEYRKGDPKNGMLYDVLRILQTQFFVFILFILFRAPDLSTFRLVVARIVTRAAGIDYFYTWSFVYVPFVLGVSIFAYVKNGGNSFYINLDLRKFKNKVIFCTALALTVVLMYVGENYFMYFQF